MSETLQLGQRVTFGKNNTQKGWVVKINATAINSDGTTETGLAEVYEEGTTLDVYIGPHSAFKKIEPPSGGRRKSRRRTRRRTTK